MRESMYSLRLDSMRLIGSSERRDLFTETCRYSTKSPGACYPARHILPLFLAMQLALRSLIPRYDPGPPVNMSFCHSLLSLLSNLIPSQLHPPRPPSQETSRLSFAPTQASADEYTIEQSLSFQRLLNPQPRNCSPSSSTDHTGVPQISSNTIRSFSSPGPQAQHSPCPSSSTLCNHRAQNVSVASSFSGSSNQALTLTGSPKRSNSLYTSLNKRTLTSK